MTGRSDTSALRASAFAVIAALALSTASCGQNVKPPDVKLNPAPRQRYEVTLIIPNPPGRISSVNGRVQFDIEGVQDDCMPYADKIAGIKPKSSFLVPVIFKRMSNGSFVGYFYADQLVDEDYYGLGICRWRLTGIQALFHAGDVERIASLDVDEINEERRIESLCPLDGALRDLCLTPQDEKLYDSPQYHFVAILRARKAEP